MLGVVATISMHAVWWKDRRTLRAQRDLTAIESIIINDSIRQNERHTDIQATAGGIPLTPTEPRSNSDKARTSSPGGMDFLGKLIEKRKKLEGVVEKAKGDIVKEVSSRIEDLRKAAELRQRRLEQKLGEDIFHARSEHRKKKHAAEVKHEEDMHLGDLNKKREEALKEKGKVEASIESLSPTLKERHKDDIKDWLREADLQKQRVESDLETAKAEIQRRMQDASEALDKVLNVDISYLESEFRAKKVQLVQDSDMEIQNEKRVADNKIKVVNDKSGKGIRKIHEELLDFVNTKLFAGKSVSPKTIKATIKELGDLLTRQARVERELALAKEKTECNLLSMQFNAEKKRLGDEKGQLESDLNKLRKNELDLIAEVDELKRESEKLSRENDVLQKKLQLFYEKDSFQRSRPTASSMDDRESIRSSGLPDELEARIGNKDGERASSPAPKVVVRDAPSVKRARQTESTSGEGPITVHCAGCETSIKVTDRARPIAINCLNCGQEFILTKSNQLRSRPKPEAREAAAKHRKIKVPHKTKPPKRKIVLARKPTSDSASDAPGENEGYEDPGESPSETKSDKTKTVTCSSCAREHSIPAEWTHKISCKCGRWIRTK